MAIDFTVFPDWYSDVIEESMTRGVSEAYIINEELKRLREKNSGDRGLLDQLFAVSEIVGWDKTCVFAEDHIEPLARHLETWGAHCGSPRDVYRGHLVKMLIDIAKTDRKRNSP